jgi:hypothetical protein
MPEWGEIMRNAFTKIATLLFIQSAAVVAHANDINIGVNIAGEVAPGVYGRVNIGNTPPPVVYTQPVVIVKQPHPVEPIYLNVPPGHSKHWEKHCHEYNACGRPVYFVKTAEYEPGWHGKDHEREHHEHGHDHDHGHDDHGHKHGHGHDD